MLAAIVKWKDGTKCVVKITVPSDHVNENLLKALNAVTKDVILMFIDNGEFPNRTRQDYAGFQIINIDNN
jgi:hypothetical protein